MKSMNERASQDQNTGLTPSPTVTPGLTRVWRIPSCAPCEHRLRDEVWILPQHPSVQVYGATHIVGQDKTRKLNGFQMDTINEQQMNTISNCGKRPRIISNKRLQNRTHTHTTKALMTTVTSFGQEKSSLWISEDLNYRIICSQCDCTSRCVKIATIPQQRQQQNSSKINEKSYRR